MVCASNPTNSQELEPAPAHLVAKAAVAPSLIEVTEKAAKKAKDLMNKRGMVEGALRVQVLNGGCSGMSYDMSWTDQPAPTDEVVKDKDLTVLVDRKATLFLIGTVMDYEVKDLTAGFTFTNPNEKGRCGCGESFHV